MIAALNYLSEAVRTHPFNLVTLLIAAAAVIYARASAIAAKRQANEAERVRRLSEQTAKSQAEQTSRALEIAERSTKAAEQSAEATNVVVEVGQWAWISVAEIKATSREVVAHQARSVHVLLTMRNGGNSPALEFVCSLWFEVRPQAITQIASTSLDDTSAGVVGPHEQLQLDPRFLRFTEEECGQLQDKTQFLLLYGVCRYRDIFKVTHHTRWCYRYIWETQQFAPWNSEVNTMD